MDLSHVRWVAGGTGAGKSTVARILATRHDALVYDGDRAEHGWFARATRDHPRMLARAPSPPPRN
jgi:dephospho-CoA kinase